MTYETIRVEAADGVASITLQRPDNANTLNLTMARELREAAHAIAFDSTVRAVVLTGAGPRFCAGGDLEDINSAGADRSGRTYQIASALHHALALFAGMNAPLIVAVNGVAAGAGFSMALCGDYVIAADNARFVSAYTAAGLTPDGSSTYYLAKHIGLLRAKEVMLTNRAISAEEALSWGLVTRLAPAAALAEESRAIATQLASGPTAAFGGVKRLLSGAFAAGLETQLEAEARMIADMLETEDAVRGVEAFLNKQKPVFEGR